MINMDDPKHFRLRSIVSRGFTPKEIGALEESVRVRSASVIDRMFERFPERECDFVREVAALMPLQIICDMMGIPESDEEMIFNWTNTILGVGDPEYVGSFEDLVRVGGEIFAYALALGEDRLKNPKDDIASVMMNAVVDGERLTAQEFGSFFILLVVAGNETTRTAIAHGMRELTLHRDQRDIWFNDFVFHKREYQRPNIGCGLSQRRQPQLRCGFLVCARWPEFHRHGLGRGCLDGHTQGLVFIGSWHE
jgi:cytochrome P450